MDPQRSTPDNRKIVILVTTLSCNWPVSRCKPPLRIARIHFSSIKAVSFYSYSRSERNERVTVVSRSAPHVRSGSKPEKLNVSRCFPLCPQHQTCRSPPTAKSVGCMLKDYIDDSKRPGSTRGRRDWHRAIAQGRPSLLVTGARWHRHGANTPVPLCRPWARSNTPRPTTRSAIRQTLCEPPAALHLIKFRAFGRVQDLGHCLGSADFRMCLAILSARFCKRRFASEAETFSF